MITILFISITSGALCTTLFFGWLNKQNRKTENKIICPTCLKLTLWFLLLSCVPAQGQNIGYLVCSSGEHTTCKKTQNIETVSEIAGLHFPDNSIDFAAVLSGSNFIEIRTERKRFYIEKKLVKRTRNGEMKFKKLTKRNKKRLENSLTKANHLKTIQP